MKAKMLRNVFMFVAAVSLMSGCHYALRDSYRGYGYGSDRDGNRTGDYNESRREDWRDRRDDNRRRW
jgi:hypothetical protein